MRALVVDDDPGVRDVVGLTLEELKFDVTYASDGKEGYDFIKDQLFDLIITDYNMPLVSGVELIGLIKGGSPNRRTPCIVLSGELDNEVLERFKLLSVGEILEKPLNADKLMAVAEELTRKPADHGGLSSDISECFVSALKETMTSFSDGNLQVSELKNTSERSRIIYCNAMIAIFGSKVYGSLCISLSEHLLRYLIETTFPGMEIQDLADHAEMVCELTNLCAGFSKRDLEECGIPIMIGVPVNFSLQQKGIRHFAAGSKYRLDFELAGNEGFMEFCIGKI